MRPLELKVFYLRQLKETPKCIFCNSRDNIQYFRKQAVCQKCLTWIGSLYTAGYFTKKLTIS